MVLLIGTRDGLFRTTNPTAGQLEHVREETTGVTGTQSDVFAYSSDCLYRSSDSGKSWTAVDIPDSDRITAVETNPVTDDVYLATYPPARLYVSADSGETWQQLGSFPDLPSVTVWKAKQQEFNSLREAGGMIKDVTVHPDAPDRLIAGVELAGAFVSSDDGSTWEHRSQGLHSDVHTIIPLTRRDEYIAACGSGLYRTENAGQSWARVDTSYTYFFHTYFHAALLYDDVVYTAAATGPPPTWRGKHGAETVLFESHNDADTLNRVAYPGEPNEYIMAFTAFNGQVIAGTVAQSLDEGGTTRARLLQREDTGNWRTLTHIPAGVTSLCAL